MAGNYKVGDRVLYVGDCSGWTGCECEVIEKRNDGALRIRNLKSGDTGYESQLHNLKLISKNMDIKEKFALALTKEPMKSFRKVGVTNGDNLLTEDGMNIFLSWLLNTKFAEEFKKDVVDDMIKEAEDKE